MAATYPTSPKVFTTKTNHVDVYDATHVNDLQNEVNSIETYVGTNPHGSHGSLTARLAVMVDTSGGIQGSTAFPATTYSRQFYFRNDLNTLYIRNSANDTWLQQGVSLSNVLFQYSAVVSNSASLTASYGGEIIGTTLVPATFSTQFRFLCNPGGAVYRTVWITQWKKTTGVSTINSVAQLWTNNTDGGCKAALRLSIGTVSSTGFSPANCVLPSWSTVSGIDVSGLSNGTIYDVVAEIARSDGSTAVALMGNLVAFGA